ncbi:MAG TPA: metalloregulator ArsR/SmtB family transcription factor [Rectinemataceae bacterium]|nr:metalloregulator ArsR/SmtB family transcription factor [Rectinemataceae bacterium]
MQNSATDRRFDRAAQTLSLLANGKRLEILVMLLEHDRSVSELVSGSGSSFSAISQQLKLLTLGGLLEKQRQGRNIYYRLRDANAGAILRLVNEVMAEQAQ